jgi:hypothetical protein
VKLTTAVDGKRKKETFDPNREDEYGITASEYRGLDRAGLRAVVVERIEIVAKNAEEAAEDAAEALKKVRKARGPRDARQRIVKVQEAARLAEVAAARAAKLATHPSLEYDEDDWDGPEYDEDDETHLLASEGGSEALDARDRAQAAAASAEKTLLDAQAALKPMGVGGRRKVSQSPR